VDFQCPYDHSQLPLPPDVQKTLEQRLFALISGIPEPNLGDDQTSYSSLIHQFLDPVLQFFTPWQPAFIKYLSGYPHLAGRIAHQILHHLADLLESLGLFSEMLDQAQSLFASQRDQQGSLEKKALATLQTQHSISQMLEPIHKTLFRILVRSLPHYLDSMVELAKSYRYGEDKMRDCLGTSLGWDLDPGTVDKDGLTTLADLAQGLQEDQDFQDLILRLGKSYHSQLSTYQGLPPEQEFLALGKQELLGIGQGRDLESLVPSALALASHPQGFIRFQLDYAQEQLPQFTYRSVATSVQQSPDSPQEHLGPFILCLDTSGSMTGYPERIAKTLTLSALQQAKNLNRQVIILGFSHKLTQLLWEPPYPIQDLLSFLSRPFHGGTDLRPALESSIHFIRHGNYYLADILIISDFRIPKIMIKKSPKLRLLQEEYQTKIHALTVGLEPIVDDYNLFDSCWICWPENHDTRKRIQETF